MRRFIFLAAMAGLVMGAYDLYIEAGISRVPQRIAVKDLVKNPPSNRHLTVTNGKLLVDQAVKYTESSHDSTTVTEEYYVPLQEESSGKKGSMPPKVLVKVSKARMDQIARGDGAISPEGVRGIRVTTWNIADKAQDLLEKTYGAGEVQEMLVIDLERLPVGFIAPVSKLFAGIAGLVLAFIPWGKARPAQA